MLARVLEPEVMDTADEAADYDTMDHSAVNTVFVADFLAANPDVTRVLDLGTGTARIPIELCQKSKIASVVAVDLAEHMLAIARKNVVAVGFGVRIELVKIDAKSTHFRDEEFSAIVSNSIIHHIPEPERALAEMWRVLAPGGLLFVRDLVRPAAMTEVDALVAKYSGAPENDSALAVKSFVHQRALFRDSLCAALTVEEVSALARAASIESGEARMTSDRHWTLMARKAVRNPAKKSAPKPE